MKNVVFENEKGRERSKKNGKWNKRDARENGANVPGRKLNVSGKKEKDNENLKKLENVKEKKNASVSFANGKNEKRRNVVKKNVKEKCSSAKDLNENASNVNAKNARDSKLNEWNVKDKNDSVLNGKNSSVKLG